MTPKRLLTVVALAIAAAFPASASAQFTPSVPPPNSDHYLDSFVLTSNSRPLKYNDSRIFTADTTNYTVQSDVFNPCYADDQSACHGGPPEPNVCVYPTYRTVYGRTIWAAFQSRHWGRMNIRTSTGTFDTVIGLVRFRSLEDSTPQQTADGQMRLTCYDNKVGFTESATQIVRPRKWYAIQIGGTTQDSSADFGGPVQIGYELLKPKKVTNTAPWKWVPNPTRITIGVRNPFRGLHISLRCTKGACKRKSLTIGGKRALGKQGSLAPGSVFGAGPGKDASAGSDAVVRAAKVRQLLKRKRVKPGAKITLRMTAYGRIGKFEQWKVTRNGVKNPVIRCMNVGSKKPRKRCHG